MTQTPKPGTTVTPGDLIRPHHPSAVRVRIFRGLAGITGMLFLLLAVSNALAPWVSTSVNPSDPQPELHRWFTTMSGATDAIGAVCLVALAVRPRQTLLAVNVALGLVVAALLVIPFTPAFVILLLFFVPVLVTYPYRGDLRLRSIPRDVIRTSYGGVVSAAAAAMLFVAALALTRQLSATDSAAEVGAWAEYAEHAVLLALSTLLAMAPRPGWRVLRGASAIAWLYLGLVGSLVLPDQQASWGHGGGIGAIALGAFLAWLTVHPHPHRRRRHDSGTAHRSVVTDP